MLVPKNGPRGWWFLLPVLALCAGLAFAAGGAQARPGGAPLRSPGAAPQNTYLSTDVPKVIPTNGTVTSTLQVADALTVSSIDVVSIAISHTYPGDLNVYLMSPHGTRVQLISNNNDGACGGIDFNDANTGFSLSDGAVLPIGAVCPPGNGSYKPFSPLAAFAGEQAQGTWSLVINDSTIDPSSDAGQLDGWGLAIPGAAPQATPTTVPLPTEIPQPTPLLCAVPFTDVHTSDYFYTAVSYLLCKNPPAISGYADNTFRPYNNTTRGQLAKIVVLGLDVPMLGAPATPSFTDVPPTNPFFAYIEAAKTFGIVSGYADHTFHPFAPVTRGQLAKMVMTAKGVDLITPSSPTFTDVTPGNPFYSAIETAACYGIVSGYADHTFRPGNNATRGQIAKIVYLAETSDTPCAAVPTPLPRVVQP